MIIIYSLTFLLVMIAISKMVQTWKLSADIAGEKPHAIVRGFYGFFDFISDLVSLKIFK